MQVSYTNHAKDKELINKLKPALYILSSIEKH